MNTDVTDTLEVTVDQLLSDEGSVVIFGGTTESGRYVTFGVDHRLAEPLAMAVVMDEEATAVVEPWQILNAGHA